MIRFLIEMNSAVKEVGQKLLYYGIYCLILLAIMLLVTSFFSFFHFLLEHNFKVIEVWVQENLWETLIFTKAISFFICYQLLRVHFSNTSLDTFYFDKPIELPGREFYVQIIFLSLASVFIYKPVQAETWTLFHFLSNFLFQILFFLPDFLIVSFLLKRNPYKTIKESILENIIASLIFWFGTYLLASNKDMVGIHHFLQFFIILFLFKQNMLWTSGVLGILILVGFFNPLMGVNLFSEIGEGPFQAVGKFSIASSLFLILLCHGYNRYKQIKTLG